MVPTYLLPFQNSIIPFKQGWKTVEPLVSCSNVIFSLLYPCKILCIGTKMTIHPYILFHVSKNMRWYEQTEQRNPGFLFPSLPVFQLLLGDITMLRSCNPTYDIPLVCPRASSLFSVPGIISTWRTHWDILIICPNHFNRLFWNWWSSSSGIIPILQLNQNSLPNESHHFSHYTNLKKHTDNNDLHSVSG